MSVRMRSRRSAGSRSPPPSNAWAIPTRPCAGPRLRPVFPKSRCVQRPSSSRASQTASAVVRQRLRPALVARPIEQRPRGKKPARRAPHHFVGIALAALEDPRFDQRLERHVPSDTPRDHEVAGLAAEEAGVGCPRQLEVLRFRELRRLTRTLERPPRGCREVDSDVGVPSAPERIERPDDPRGSAIETRERRRRPPRVPLLRRPQRHRVEPFLGIRDDRADPASNALLVPRLVRQLLECVRPKEHFWTG